MNCDNPRSHTAAEKMKSVKACCEKADVGPKKEAALKHCDAAETAHAAHDDAETHKELDGATHALA